jgi:hypothetical protein
MASRESMKSHKKTSHKKKSHENDWHRRTGLADDDRDGALKSTSHAITIASIFSPVPREVHI